MKKSIKVYKVENSETIKANVSLVIEDAVAINDITIIEGKNGLFVSWPQRVYEKDGEKKYKNISNPVTAEAREELNKAIMDAYDAAE